MRRRDKPLDINKKLQIVRSIDDLIVDDESTVEKSKYFDADFFKAPALSKKKLNIPVCNVQNDLEYHTIVTADYVIPQNYVRHAKKIGDEDDVTIDYNADEKDIEWLERNPKLLNDPEIKKQLSLDILEKIFNVLERNTGCGDPLDPASAERIVSQVLLWKPHVSTRIFSDVYQYWLHKRNLIHKPLCRRYWPQTANTDTDPHHVFRPREKERYRLRKHRKNDLASFRKLQSLRREFGKARVLMQLVVERELLKQAQLRIQEQVFCQRLFHMSSELGHGSEACTEEFVRHKLRFDHLQAARESELVALASSQRAESLTDGGGFAVADGGENTGLKLTLKMKGAQGTGEGGGGSRKKKSDTSRSRKRDRSSMGQAGGSGAEAHESEEATPEGSVGPLLKVARVSGTSGAGSGSLPLNSNPGLPQSPWPSFMDHLDTREYMRIPRSMSEYLDDLELRPFWDSYDDPEASFCVPYRVRHRARVGRGGRIVMDRYPIYRSRPSGDLFPTDFTSLSSGGGGGGGDSSAALALQLEEYRHTSSSDTLRYVYPTHIASTAAQQYHVHCAELSTSFFSQPIPSDMPPLSGDTSSSSAATNAQDARAFAHNRPACSPFDPQYIRQAAGVVGGGESHYLNQLMVFASQLSPTNQSLLFGSLAPQPTGEGAMQSRHCAGGAAEMSVCPLLAPPERDALAAMVTPEEVDIYRMSDSEDEVIEVPSGAVTKMPALVVSNRQIVDHSAVKYSYRV